MRNNENDKIRNINYQKLLDSYRLTDRVLLQSLDNCNLTIYEKTICFFICKQVHLKEIANYLDHSYDSIKKTKQRIIHKLNLKKDVAKDILARLSAKAIDNQDL